MTDSFGSPDDPSNGVEGAPEPAVRVDPREQGELGGEWAGKDGRAGGLAPSEAFQTLASEVRVTVLCELLAAERAGETPCTFSELQEAAGADSSAGFAYHLRQLDDYFVSRTTDGYKLTPEGRRAARTIVSGAFTAPPRDGRAS